MPQHSAAEVERALEAVLADRAFDWDEEPSLLERLFERFADDGPSRSTDYSWAETLGEVAAYALLVLLLAAILFGLVQLVRERRRRRAEAPDAEELERRVRRRVLELRDRAREALGEGDLRLSLRLLLFALVVGLGERGDLEFREAWTNRELLARGTPRPEARRVLEGLVEDLEPKEFGTTPIEREDLERLFALCARYLGEETA